MPEMDSSSAKTVFEMAVKYAEAVQQIRQIRIQQLWKARFTAWTLLIVSGAFFIQHSTESNSIGAVKWVAPVLGLIISVFHMLFEFDQERAIGKDRVRVYKWLDHAETILVKENVALELGGPQSPESRGPEGPPVVKLRLWVLSYILTAVVTILLWH